MRPRKAAAGRRNSTAAASPERKRSSFDFRASSDRSSVSSFTSSRAASSLLDDEQAAGYLAGDGSRWLRDDPILEGENRDRGGRVAGSEGNPRSFPYSVKQQCWEKAEKVKGRDPDRWRRDPLGNIIFRKLVGCPGCLCHDYDHILPYSKGGQSTLENCQVLQATVNRSKGNKTHISKSDLMQKSAYCRVSGRDMDLLELSAYGNTHRVQDSSGCNIQ